ncbi:MAG: hypothetical protein ACYDDS_08575 [Candidatus Sulfotelmatobacter sp.]
MPRPIVCSRGIRSRVTVPGVHVVESFLGGIARTSVLCDDFLGEFMSVHGMLVRLLAELMSGQMISFAVSGSSGGVGMGGKVVEFGNSIVRALRHGVLSRNEAADR